MKLDGPVFKEGPLYGVMGNVVDLNGTPYMWLSYVDGDRLDVLPLSYPQADLISGYRVIDWLCSAKPEEPPGRAVRPARSCMRRAPASLRPPLPRGRCG